MYLPLVTYELLSTLRRLYPDRLARTPQTEYEQGIAVGRQQIIDKLQQLYDKEVSNGGPKDLL